MKLGKKPATVDARDLLFANYRTEAALPPHPKTFGHDTIIPADGWQMLANDSVGCCVFSGFAHLVMLWNKIRGVDVVFSNESVLSDYSAVTGYVPGDPSTDQGTDVREALKYFRSTGVIDASGKRHKIAAFVALSAADLSQAAEAAWLFAGIAPGFNLPQSAETQFDDNKPWSVVRGSPTVGGHFVPVVGERAGDGTFGGILSAVGIGIQMRGITWGRDIGIGNAGLPRDVHGRGVGVSLQRAAEGRQDARGLRPGPAQSRPGGAVTDLGERARSLLRRTAEATTVDAIRKVAHSVDRSELPARELQPVVAAVMRRASVLVQAERAEAAHRAYASGFEVVPTSTLAPRASLA